MNEGDNGCITVVIVDDHPVMCVGTGALLGAYSDFRIVGSALDGRSALRLIAEVLPRVVVLDVQLPDMDAIAVVRELQHTAPETAVLILTGHDDLWSCRELLDLGVKGYLRKTVPIEDIAASIRSIVRGISIRGPDLPCVANGSFAVRCTQREIEVLRLIAAGNSNREIAQTLEIAERTVEFHVSNLLTKLEARSRTDAVSIAVRDGLISLSR